MAQERLVISNTTPIINLAEIDRLDILESLFGNIVIPPAVRDELTEKGSLFKRAAEAAASGRFKIVPPADKLLVKGFSGSVHRGEAECLALAMENPESLLLLDDLAARNLAATSELTFTGTLGCLVEAKSQGLIDKVLPLLGELRSAARFWISQELETVILQNAGEAE